MENIKKNQMELLEQKIQHLKGKKINSRLDTVEEKNSEVEDIEIKYIQNEAERKNTGKNPTKVSAE